MCDGDIHQSLFAIGMCDLRSQRYSFMAKNKSRQRTQPLFSLFFSFFFQKIAKKIGKCLHENKNHYIFAMISEMKCKTNKIWNNYGIKNRT